MNLVGYGYRVTITKAKEGDAFVDKETGHLMVASTEDWQDVGQIKGDKGDTGATGKSAYLHIKYAKSLTENDWSDNNGETPSTYIGVYADDNPVDQLVWSLYSWSKWQGEDGFGYEYIYLRTSSATAPSTPTEQSQEDDFVPSGWTDDPTGVSASYMYEWVCYRKKTLGVWGAFIGSASDNSKAALWAKYGQTGAKGDYTEMRFAKNGSTTTPPTLSVNSIAPSGWTTTTPSVGIGEYLWMTSAKKSAAGALLTTWSTPVRVSGINGMKGDKGEDGSSPAMVYRGEYSASKKYYGNEYRLDCVLCGNTWYIARIDAGEFTGVQPPDKTKWNPFGATFESIATGLLIAELANIAGFIFRNGRLESQTLADGSVTDGANSKTPMVYMNGKTGQVGFAGGKVLFNADGTVSIGNGKFTIDANGNVVLKDLTMNNITANSGTFKGTLYATNGIVYNVKTITANYQTLTTADAFVIVNYHRTSNNDACVLYLPRNPNNGQIITIKNVDKQGYDVVYLNGNGHNICPGTAELMGSNYDPYDGGAYMYVKCGRAQQYIFDGSKWQQVGQYEW